MLRAPMVSGLSRLAPIVSICWLALAAPDAVHAQVFGQPGGDTGTSPMCQRLEGQLAAITRGGADPAKAEQIRRYEETISRQQGELQRVQAQGQRLGCEGGGFFSLFTGQSPQCGPVNNQIQQMRANIDRMIGDLQRLQGGANAATDREGQRRAVIFALAQNNCGPQYANAARSMQQGSLIDNLFGNSGSGDFNNGAPANTFRTVCVRTCDGSFFPISFATDASRFADDEQACKRQCPATEVQLFTYRNPGEDMKQAVSVSGTPYSQLPNAFKYRSEFNPSCSCKPAGQTWADAMKHLDDRGQTEQGDILVTDDRAKKMSQPRGVSLKSETPSTSGSTNKDQPARTIPDANKPVRAVGPTFLPKQ